jgi:transposase
MRGSDFLQGSMFCYVDIEGRIPENHPLRELKRVVDGILRTMSPEFDQRYANIGRPSIPPERLLRALLLQTMYTVRSERQLMEQLDYNLLFRWFVGLGIDDPVWDRTVFCANRDRLLEQKLLRLFFDRVLELAKFHDLCSDEHFSVDGTMIEAWASQKSVVRKDDTDTDDNTQGGGRNEEVDFKGETRSNATHQSTTDPDAKLYKKAKFAEAKPRHLTHIVMENRNGLVVDVETTQANGTAEREAAEKMAQRTLNKPGSTLGADKGYDTQAHQQALKEMGVTPHTAAKSKGSAVDEAIRSSEGYASSLKLRKRIEECFGWAKTVGGFRKTRFIGTAKVQAQALLTFAALNLTRMKRLLGWCAIPA